MEHLNTLFTIEVQNVQHDSNNPKRSINSHTSAYFKLEDLLISKKAT